MTTKKRAKQFYFTKNDDDLYNAIQAIPDGERNHEIRRALRHWFLGGGRNYIPPMRTELETATEQPQKPQEPDNKEILDKEKLPDDLVSF